MKFILFNFPDLSFYTVLNLNFSASKKSSKKWHFLTTHREGEGRRGKGGAYLACEGYWERGSDNNSIVILTYPLKALSISDRAIDSFIVCASFSSPGP